MLSQAADPKQGTDDDWNRHEANKCQGHGILYSPPKSLNLTGVAMLIKNRAIRCIHVLEHYANQVGVLGQAHTLSSSSTGSTPKNGRVADPGFRAVAPGSGVIMCAPVSVCHQVSTIGVLPPPTTWNTTTPARYRVTRYRVNPPLPGGHHSLHLRSGLDRQQHAITGVQDISGDPMYCSDAEHCNRKLQNGAGG